MGAFLEERGDSTVSYEARRGATFEREGSVHRYPSHCSPGSLRASRSRPSSDGLDGGSRDWSSRSIRIFIGVEAGAMGHGLGSRCRSRRASGRIGSRQLNLGRQEDGA